MQFYKPKTIFFLPDNLENKNSFDKKIHFSNFHLKFSLKAKVEAGG